MKKTLTVPPSSHYKYCLILLSFFFVFIFTACENHWIKEITSHMFEEPKKGVTHAVGDIGPGGGIVFYVDPDGFIMLDTGERLYHLEVTLEVLNYSWIIGVASDWYYNYIPTKSGIGTGRYNTNLILSYEPNYAPAAERCKDFSGGGLADWFLPSIAELEKLDEIYTDWFDIIGDGWVWSSENCDISGLEAEANMYRFHTTPFTMPTNKSTPLSIHPIRAF